MRKVVVFSLLLALGLVASQLLPLLGEANHDTAAVVVRVLTMIGLSFIMIHVGLEFELDKSRLREYGWDYVVAATAAAFPWIIAACYFVFVLSAPDQWGDWRKWEESLLQGRFASPTSAGVLFSMLAAAGLSTTWVFKKARVLAVFDDLDTILFMVPLTAMIIGLRWQLFVLVAVLLVLLVLAWKYMGRWNIPFTWGWVLTYAVLLAGLSELVTVTSHAFDPTAPVHLEVLLPAFVLGCVMRRPHEGLHEADAQLGIQPGLDSDREQLVSTIVSACFMVLVGLSMPPIGPLMGAGAGTDGASLSWGAVGGHVLLLTVLINVGKMFPVFCYRREVPLRQRFALSVALFPRGEVGAGVLVVSLGYGIGGAALLIALLSLALNLLLTGVFIAIVRKLIGTEMPEVALPERA